MNNTAIVQNLNVNSVYDDITTFLNQFESIKTRGEYKRDIEEFFQFFHGKELSQLTKTDVEYLTSNEKFLQKHVLKYSFHLQQKNKKSTVLRKIYSVRSLYKFLAANEYKANPLIFMVKNLKSNPNSYGVIHPKDVEPMAELAMYERNGDEMSAFIHLASTTSIRATALLNLKLSDIHYHEQSKFYEVTTYDKGNVPVKRPIEPWLYERLVKITKDGKVFPNLKHDKVNKTIQRVARKLGIPEHIRITTHSLRKTAPSFEMSTSGNVKRAMEQTGHKNAQTLLDHYTDKTVNYASLAGIRMKKKVDEKVLDTVSKKDILEQLKKLNPNAYIELLHELSAK